ncbi:TRAP transporter large permease [Chakrabartyella piscis]|uniref:TRAP transporter large permease n=1 Tax=Chakrabartyella piscis TaxID=2918914 RepID=UPI002958DF74|nr:TRAP transporter large permease [Chakrabartyella piscis]
MNLDIWIPIFTILTLALLNIPIWIAILGGVLPYFIFLQPDLPIQIVAQRIVAVTESSSYMAIPYFVTAGAIMNYSGISKRLMDLADGLVGHLTGGLGHVNVVLSVLMGGISGSAAADAAMECKILVPEMEKRGYDRNFSAAITVGSSLITPIIPPGMGLIVFAFATQISVGRMFAAGYVPGLLCMIFMMIYVYIVSKKRNYKGTRTKMASPREIGRLFVNALWALIIPFGIVMGLRQGAFTATEAGAICAWYALFIGVFVYKEIKKEHIWLIAKESILGTATVMILICIAGALSYFLTYERIPQALSSMMLGMDLNKYQFLLMVNVLLLMVGMFMEGGAPQIILGPLLMPIALSLGIDPIHFGIIFVFNLGIGNMTPPFGIVLYQVSGLLNVKLTSLSKACMPFILIMILVLMLITFIPDLVLCVPNLIYGVA